MRHWRTGEVVPDWVLEADSGWEKAPRSNKLRRKGPGGQWEYKDSPSEEKAPTTVPEGSGSQAPTTQESVPQKDPAAMEDALKGIDPGGEEPDDEVNLLEDYEDLPREKLLEKIKNEGESFVDYIDLQSSMNGINTEKVYDWLDKNGFKDKSNKEKIDKIDKMLQNKTWLKRFQSGSGYFD